MSGWTPHDMDIDEPDTADEHAEVTMFAASPTQSPQQLRESLKDAKERYVAEKEKYRRERALRRLERERMRNRSGERSVHPEDSDVAMTDGEAPDSAQPVTSEEDRTPEKKKAGDAPAANSPLQIISTARGPFPQLEMFPVPVRRSHTMHGTGQRNPAVASVSSAAVDVITRRLNDMGFTADAYPSIPEQISTRVPRNAQLSREAEDTIVTDVLEHLLEASPAVPPQASGSGDVASSSNATDPSS